MRARYLRSSCGKVTASPALAKTSSDCSLRRPFDGIASVRAHNAEGHSSYLLGRVSTSGFWYYFPVVLGVKTPIAFLILLLLGFWIAWKNRA